MAERAKCWNARCPVCGSWFYRFLAKFGMAMPFKLRRERSNA